MLKSFITIDAFMTGCIFHFINISSLNARCIKVGFNAGDGVNYYAVPGSMTDSMLSLPRMSNIGIPGQFVFRVDLTNITNAGHY